MAKLGLVAVWVSGGVLAGCMMLLPGGMLQPSASDNDAAVPASASHSTAGK